MLHTADLGETRDEELSGDETDSTSSEEDSESDYEEFKKKRRQRRKKKQQKRKLVPKKGASGRETQSFQGNEEEIARLVTRLSKMNLEDPEYAPIYYKVMVMDRSGIAERCVKPPQLGKGEVPRIRPPSRTGVPRTESSGVGAASYPNNIPLGRPTGGGNPSGNGGANTGQIQCFGCDEDGHRMSDCPHLGELVRQGVIYHNEEIRRLVMKNGAPIRKMYGETLVKAATRIAGLNAPCVMLGLVDAPVTRQPVVEKFYQSVYQSAYIEHTTSNESLTDSEEIELSTSDEDSHSVPSQFHGVYLTKPQPAAAGPWYVQPVERTETGVRRTRKQVFDGVYPPRREKIKSGEVRDLQARPESQLESREAAALPQPLIPNRPKPAVVQPQPPTPPKHQVTDSSAGQSHARPPTPNPATHEPDIRPIDARRVRFSNDDVEMAEGKEKAKGPKTSSTRMTRPAAPAAVTGQDNAARGAEEGVPSRGPGRQSELAATVNKQQVMDRILNAQIPMSLREIFVTSKEIRTEIQDLIKVKNVRAVLLGSSADHPLIANIGWPRSEGVLIKIDMKTGGKDICAIIDTGSQLDVVRADIAGAKISQAIDMSQVTNMNDANGGRGQLQGYIRDVEFSCGEAITMTDLWVSQKAPFALLLGRPWQRGNLVSIDERDEGTYLIFKDRETHCPCYELLAVPYEGPSFFQHRNTTHYQSFAFLKEGDSQPNSWATPLEHHLIECVIRKAKILERVANAINPSPLGSFLRRIPESPTNGRRACHRHTSQADGPEHRIEAGLILIHTAFRIFAALGALCLYHCVLREEKSQEGKIHKEKESASRPSPKTPIFSRYPMSLPSPTLDPSRLEAPLPVNNVLPAALEKVQYLSRSTLNRPPMPVVSLSTEGPVATIADAVVRQWQRYADRQPLDVDPTFVAAPQSEYYGHVVLPNGQVLHRSSSANAFRVFRDRETGLPFTMSCHEFTFHVTTPGDPQKTWDLELCYLSDERLRQAMSTMNPLVPPVGGEVGFPVNAIEHAPPMLPLSERLQINQVSVAVAKYIIRTHRLQSLAAGTASAGEVIAPERMTVDPGDLEPLVERRKLRGPPLMVPPDDVLKLAPCHAYGGGKDAMRAMKREAELSKSVRRRTRESTTLEDDIFGSDDSDYGDIPGLVGSVEDSRTNSSADLGICGLCFESQHESTLDCPLFRPKPSKERVVGGDGSSEGVLTEQRMMEMQQVLDIALGPTMREWLTLPPAAVPFQALVAAAGEARKAFEEYTVEFEWRREEEEKGIVRGMESTAADGLQALRREQGVVKEGMDRKTAERRADSPFPRLPRVTRDLSHTAHLIPPNFNVNRGNPVTRDEWSSSASASPSSSVTDDDAPVYDNDEDDDSNSREIYYQQTLSPGNWSPAVSEWSVEAWDLLSPFFSNPQRIIDEALSRALPRNSTTISLPSDSATELSGDEDYPSSSDEDGAAQIVQDLRLWTYEGNAHQVTHLRFEDEMGSEPANRALRALHGPLSKFVDYPAMAAEGVLNLRCPSPLPFKLANFPSVPDSPVSDDLPDVLSAPTSLDFVLPTSAVRSTVGTRQASPALLDDGAAGDLITGSGVPDTADIVGREWNPDDEEGGLNQNGMRKKTSKFHGDKLRRMVIEREALKATGYTDPVVIRMMAGVRLATLEAARRIEDLVWHRYGIHEGSFPDRFLHHPFLFNIEAAKMQTLWHILQRNGRYQLANVLYEVALNPPSGRICEDALNYWELLEEPGTVSNTTRTFPDHMVHGDDTDDDSDTNLQYPPSEDGSDMSDLGHRRDSRGPGLGTDCAGGQRCRTGRPRLYCPLKG
ncbi:RT-RNaseH-2 domain-containing protein [Mycena venus]|uniref:RT-RNaseH-2 domain-containing protein n=1 Tax=Mycena venus TaxID=2733690 RepID=A0A8H7D4H3_9AGAR|nr:RT-RNaseH-2 domain-containing protein [Mycena venus]